MREIKFRFWKIDEKIMTCSYGLIGIMNLDNSYHKGLNSENHIWMQYTGQKDKNGNDIWEGDILGPPINDNISLDECYRGEFCRGEVCWNKRSSAFEISMRNHLESWIDGLGGIGCYEEVIGNIYENPELRVIKDA